MKYIWHKQTNTMKRIITVIAVMMMLNVNAKEPSSKYESRRNVYNEIKKKLDSKEITIKRSSNIVDKAQESTKIDQTILRVISAGERAVEELIKVAEEEIITGSPDDDLAADRLKNAAATKKLAIFDAFEILQRIENERERLNDQDESQTNKGKDNGFQSFAESRSRKS